MTPLEHDLLAYWPDVAGFGRVGMRVINHLDRPGYHGQAHVLTVLDKVEELARAQRVNGLSLITLRLAAFFHDYVHDGVHGQDEDKSAQAAAEQLTLYSSLSAAEIDRVQELIFVTKNHDPEPGDMLGEIISDADLWILSSSPYDYARYMADVRDEYRDAVDDYAFAKARHQVLCDLRKGGIYTSRIARGMWEEKASVNVGSEIQWLEWRYGL